MGNVLYPSFSSLSSSPHNGLSCPLCFAVRRFPVVPLGLLVGFCLDTSLRASGVCPNKSNARTRWRGVGRTWGYPLSVLPRDSNALSESLSYLGVDGVVNVHKQAENNVFSIFRKFKSMFWGCNTSCPSLSSSWFLTILSVFVWHVHDDCLKRGLKT